VPGIPSSNSGSGRPPVVAAVDEVEWLIPPDAGIRRSANDVLVAKG